MLRTMNYCTFCIKLLIHVIEFSPSSMFLLKLTPFTNIVFQMKII